MPVPLSPITRHALLLSFFQSNIVSLRRSRYILLTYGSFLFTAIPTPVLIVAALIAPVLLPGAFQTDFVVLGQCFLFAFWRGA